MTLEHCTYEKKPLKEEVVYCTHHSKCAGKRANMIPLEIGQKMDGRWKING